jgi:hypothetical protein
MSLFSISSLVKPKEERMVFRAAMRPLKDFSGRPSTGRWMNSNILNPFGNSTVKRRASGLSPALYSTEMPVTS